VYQNELARLERATAAAQDGNRPVARAEVQAFIDDVVRAIPKQVTPEVAAEVLAVAGAAVDRLSG
jgi:cell division septum initiation protein DivIVA